MFFLCNRKNDTDLKLILSAKFKQSVINEKEVKKKMIKAVMNALKENKALKTLFKSESPILIFDISEDKENDMTQYSVKLINLNDETIKVLKMDNKWQEDDRVFTSKYDGHMNLTTCIPIIRKIVNKYKLPKITFHEFRYTYILMQLF